MSALNRLKRFAAVLTLLLFITTTALAGPPSRPVERPDGPPEPNPTEVGDPDTGGNLTRDRLWYLLIASTMDNAIFRRIVVPMRMRFNARPSAPTLPLRRR